MDTKEQQHDASVRAIYALIEATGDADGIAAALQYVYAHHDAGLRYLLEKRGREPAYNFAQGRADGIITPSLAK